MSKTLEERRVGVLDAAKEIIEGAKSAGRQLSADERRDVQSKMRDAEKLLTQIKQADSDAALRGKLAHALRGDTHPLDSKSGRFSAKGAVSQLVEQIAPSTIAQKALAPSGTAVAPAGLTELEPVPLGRPVTRNLLSVIGAQLVKQPPTFSYLRQTVRTNNAAAVASGAEKPVSVFGLTRIEDRLRVIAHLSENIDRYWIEDSEELRQFVEDELAYGLDVAIERQLLTGDGIGENNRGMLNTSGIQTQAWSVDGHETVLRGLTLLEAVAGAQSAVVALHPNDWLATSLTRATTGEFIGTDATSIDYPNNVQASPPVGSPVLLSWGAPVVLSTALPEGTGVVFDPTAVRLYVDGNVDVRWSEEAGFSTNTVRARVETRVGVAVRRPLGIVSVDMSAA